MQLDCAFLLDAPAAAAGPTAESWVQVAKTGAFQDPRYGKFTITQQDFSRWLSNFNSLSVGDGREGLPVDRDHSPEKRGDTEAVGWVKALEQRGDQMWGRVEWNSEGQTLVADKRYAYISPSYSRDYKDEAGKPHGTALVGIALTNRPFLQMATVNLSAFDFADTTVEPENTPEPAPAYNHRQMDLSKLLTAMNVTLSDLGLDDKSDEATVLSAISTHQAKLNTPPKAPEGSVTLSAEAVSDLIAKANRGEAAANELHLSKFENMFSAAQQAGKVVPAQKDTFKTLFDASPESTLTLLSELQPVVSMAPQGHGLPAGTDASLTLAAGEFVDRAAVEPMAVDQDMLQLHATTEAIANQKGIPYEQALVLAQSGMTV